jgi:fructose-1,6-bisphosphatase/inositol monophosphatase family enzyme
MAARIVLVASIDVCLLSTTGWKAWDYAAGMVIVTEAGAVISTLRGEDFSIYSKSMVCAANDRLARKLIGSVASVK